MSGFLEFSFSEPQSLLRDSLRRYLEKQCPPSVVRDVLEGRRTYAASVWRGLAELGCLGAAIPEEHGGAGLGYVELCIVAEELGRALAPVPSFSSLYLYAELIKAAGTDEQKAACLGAIADGRAIGVLAHLELSAARCASTTRAYVEDGILFGVKDLVPDGLIADAAIVLARDGARGVDAISLFHVDANGSGVARTPLDTIDPSRRYARLAFDGAPATRVGAIGQGGALLDAAFRRAAVFVAFEQVGGAERALELACDYARARHAFGRPIGSFQAVKQLLADMYVSLKIAQSNAHYAAWALESVAADADLAAARAHVSATHAFRHCAADMIQVHGGAGFMWEVDAHLFYRRAELLGQCLGGASVWSRNLVAALSERVGAAH